jgi:hypothetical protein
VVQLVVSSITDLTHPKVQATFLTELTLKLNMDLEPLLDMLAKTQSPLQDSPLKMFFSGKSLNKRESASLLPDLMVFWEWAGQPSVLIKCH